MKNIIIFVVFSLLISKLNNSKNYYSEIKIISEVIKKHNYNSNFCILVDFSIHSGKNRMFLYNIKKGMVEDSFLVAHGRGSGQSFGKPKKFSNVSGSNCSSLGLAVTEGRDYSKWGVNIKYWLRGLDKTNNNLKKRVVVLHSWTGVPDFEVYPITIHQSQGCFTVSNNTMEKLDKLIKSQKNKHIVIYSFK